MAAGLSLRTPPGYRREEFPGGVILVRERRASEIEGAGLLDPDAWERRLRGSATGPGRGAMARVDLPGGGGAILKRMRRGGLVARLWRDRFAGTARLLGNLSLPPEARARGIATPEPLALLVRREGAGTVRACLAVEEVPGSEDLLTRLGREPVPGEREIAAVLEFVRRMHDAGLRHRDLNLANLLVRPSEGSWKVHVIDLDRASLHPEPLPYRLRLAALRRLERSYEKHLGGRNPLGPEAVDLWYSLYAGADQRLAARLRSSRPVGRILLALHRFSW